MEKEIIKQGVELAEKELREKQIQEVKKIVLKTLEKIDKTDKEIVEAKNKVKELEETKKLLKMDIDDLKEGRVDRIAERQEKDEKAKDTSVVIIIKEKETVIEKPIPYWYYPYQVIWKTEYVYPSVTVTNPAFGMSTTGGLVGYSNTLTHTHDGNSVTNSGNVNWSEVSNTHFINCSVAKFATIGAYTINGEIINLR